MQHYLQKLMAPASVAIIGASTNPVKAGHAVVKNLLESGFTGAIYPVNPRGREILGLKCYKNVHEIAADRPHHPPEVAVIAIPASLVLQTAEDCARAGVKFLVVLTAGFKETGPAGMELEKKLLSLCRKHGIRLLGPNCVGLIHMHTPLNASFARGFPRKGNISFISQSGAMLVSIIDWSRTTGLGFSHFVSLGNKGDLQEVDFLEYAAWDPTTRVILFYLEDVTDGNKFLDFAVPTSMHKPIIVVKAGITPAGVRAASSHTGALAGAERAYRAAFHQGAILKAEGMEELFDMALAFSTQPLPPGDRIVIVTNAGGPGILTTDRLERRNLKLSHLSGETIETLRGVLPSEAGFYNPVDLLGDADARRYRFALETIQADPNVDGIIVLLGPTAMTAPLEIARAIGEFHKNQPSGQAAKPLICVLMGGLEVHEGSTYLRENGIPCYNFPEGAVNAMEGMVRYTLKVNALKKRAQQAEKIPSGKNKSGKNSFKEAPDSFMVKAAFYDAVRERRTVMMGYEGVQVLHAYRIPVAPTFLAREADEAARLAERVGYPVVLKIASPQILHKSDLGGVVVGLDNSEAVKNTFRELNSRVRQYAPAIPLFGIEVQKMMPSGMEIIVGSSFDLQFGPLIVFGLGGIYVNLFEDVSLRLARNLCQAEVEEMIKETKAYRLLKGYRGSRPLDLNSIKRVILATAALVTDFPEISELDINPLLVYENGVCAVDVKITLSHHLFAHSDQSTGR